MTLDLEITVLTGCKSRKSLEDANVPGVVAQFLDGKFEEVLGGAVAKEILAENPCEEATLESCILKNVEQYVTAAAGDGQSLRELEVLVVGASCLQLFVQNNWTGPATLTNPQVFLPQSFFSSSSSSSQNALQQSALGYLSEDGEPAYHLAAHLAYLHAARAIFMDCRHLFKALQTWEWWRARCLMVQQRLLEQRSPTLKKNILEALEQAGKKETLIHGDSNRDVAVLLHIETAQACQYYWESRMARDHVTQASQIAGISTQLTGAMGKRTRYQQEDKAQLVVMVTRSQELQPLNPVGLCDPQFSAPVPTCLPLDDDTVLDKINFTDGDPGTDTQLSPLEQALLYAVMESHRRSVAQEKLTDEEVLTYLEHIVGHSCSWAVSTSCLALRSRLQKDSRRRVERSMRQLEELFNQTTRQDPPAPVRLQLFFAAQPPAVWEIKSQLAEILMSLNLYGAALSLYEGLKLWEDVIHCYIQMGKKDKAHSVILEQLQEEETPTLLCLLGDVTGDQTHYQRAWDMSKHRSARAMRCLGYIRFREEKYEEAIECFEKSLNINSLQTGVWFTCGCVCMTARKYEAAVAAFKRCVNIDFDNFEAWSNLATAYARLGKKRNAFLTVNEAIKCNFENWRLWENCLVFATDCGEFDEAIRAYNRLMDMKDKFSDTEVLAILVKVVVNNIEDTAGQPSVRLLPNMLQIFGRMAAKVTLDSETWKLYADLCLVTTPTHPADHQKAAELLQKARRCLTQANNWEQMPDDCQKVAQRMLDINKAYMTCVDHTEDPQKAKELLNNSRLSLNGVVTTIRQRHTDPVTKELAEPMRTDCQSLDKDLQAITERLQQLQSL